MERADNFFEVKVKSTTFDIVTANTAFYQFLGRRLYNTFDMLMPQADREMLQEKIQKNQEEQGFLLHLSDENGNFYEMAAGIEKYDASGTVTIQMARIDCLYHENRQLKFEIKEYNALLSQFNSISYIYDRKTDTITSFQFKPEKHVVETISLEKWREKTITMLNESEVMKIDSLFSDLRNGIRSFEYNISGVGDYTTGTATFHFEQQKSTKITGMALYHKDVHVKTVGNVRISGMHYANETVRRDQLTGLILKEDITNLAKKRIDQLKEKTSIAIIDIDDFKSVNDNYGHMKGDEVLRKCASIISSEVEGFGSAGRIGGDEFFIVLDYMENHEDLRSLLRSIKNGILNAYSDEKDGFHISTSIGCASYPNDTDSFNDLFLLADYLLYRAKNKGKNRYITYNLEKHGTVEEILKQGIENIGINSRKGMSKSEIICKITDKVFGGEGYAVENIFNDIVDYFGVERIVLYSKDDRKVLFQCGNELLSEEQMKDTCDYIVDENLIKLYDKGALVVNNIKMFENTNPDVYEKLQKQGVLSFMHHEITGKNDKKYIVSYESVIVRNTWNTEDMYFYRILDHVLARCL
ncbi:MAG: GGDEF domain-containing protein [Thermoflexaceae bacterium]|nr:GGDEF domain-containing protein [Thermoflexaceae bacterium]